MSSRDEGWEHQLRREAIIRTAASLGIDPIRDEYWLWIAEHAVTVKLPNEWTEFEDDNGEVAYYNPKTKKLTKVHPVLTKYRAMLAKLQQFMERAGTQGKKLKPHLAVILNEVLNRCNRELPPATPEILERLALLLCIDTTLEFQLARLLKLGIESYAEDQYDIFLQAKQKADMDAFLLEIRNEQVRVDVINKPEEVIMCTELETQPARVKCEQCKDFFSLEGFAKTHNTGKRKAHTTVRCEQVTCSVYTNQLATCEVNNAFFCDRAYAEQAARLPELRRERKKVLSGLACSEYAGRVAEVLCEDCSDLFCWEAFIEMHRRGNRKRHVPLKLDDQGQLFRAGQLLTPEDCARLIDRARLAREGGPWLAFQDDQLTTYWYHLSDKVKTMENPYF